MNFVILTCNRVHGILNMENKKNVIFMRGKIFVMYLQTTNSVQMKSSNE